MLTVGVFVAAAGLVALLAFEVGTAMFGGTPGMPSTRKRCNGPDCDQSTELQRAARDVVRRLNAGEKMDANMQAILEAARREVELNPDLVKKSVKVETAGPPATRKSRDQVMRESAERRQSAEADRERRRLEREYGMPPGYLSQGGIEE